MTTPAHLAEARLAQATAEREATEQALLAIMLALHPAFARWPAALALASRELEARVEHHECPQDLAQAHSAFRRAARAESKARSAAHRAHLAPAPPAPTKPAPRPRKPKKVSVDAYVRSRWAEESEARAA